VIQPGAYLAIAALLVGGAALAQETPTPRKNVINLQIENDYFARWADADDHYSNGLRASYAWQSCAGPGCTSHDWFAAAARWDPFTGSLRLEEERWVGLSVGQSIFTPRDTNRPGLIRDDRPYAGWLYFGGSAIYQYSAPDGHAAMQNTFAFEAGVVGPSAGGQEVQNTFHKQIGADEAHGWSNQLRDEPGLNLIFERRYRTDEARLGPLEADIIPRLGASLGNVSTMGAAGGIFRIGQNLRNDFGPPQIRPSLPGSELFQARNFGWYVFIGGDGQAIGHNIFLDGNTFRDSHRIDRKDFVVEAQGGVALLLPAARIGMTFVFRSPEIEGADRWDEFGAITFSLAF
jgi:hypothetical protein